MNFITALNAHKLIEEIDRNNADIAMFKSAIDNGVEGVQLVIKGKTALLIILLSIRKTE